MKTIINKITNITSVSALILAATLILTTTIPFAAPATYATSPPKQAPFDMPVPELTAATTDTTNAKTIPGYKKTRQLLNQIYYNDIDGVHGRQSIVKATALGIINEFGDRYFRPGSQVTGYETLRMLLNLRGQEAAIMQRVYTNAGVTGKSLSPQQIKARANREYFASAQNLGILQPTEILNLNEPISRELAASFLARTLNLNPQYSQTQVYTFTDWADIAPTNRAPLEILVKQDIVPLNNDGRFAPRATLTKSELAVWVANAFDYAPTTIGQAAIGAGLVIGIETATAATTPTAGTVVIKNLDGSVIKLAPDYITYKKGIISNAKHLKPGDEIQYIQLDGETRYAGTVENGTILNHLLKTNPDAPGPTGPSIYQIIHFGTVADIRQIKEVKAGKSINKEIYRVLDVSGDVFDLVVTEDNYSGYREDIITTKNGRVGGIRLLEVGDTIEYSVSNKNQVNYIKASPITPITIKGTVRKATPITPNTPEFITVYSYDEKVHKYPVAPYAELTINERQAEIKDYVYGLPIEITVRNGHIVVAKTESFTAEPGYIPPFGKMRMGTVTNLYTGGFDIILPGAGNAQNSPHSARHSVRYDSSTQFIKNAGPVSITALKAGDKVKVFYDAISAKNASRIEIQAQELAFDKIYKGKIRNMVAQNSSLLITGADGISNPEYIVNNKWLQSPDSSVDLQIAPDCEIYIDNKRLSASALERFYSGYQVYAVVKEVYSKPTAVKISVKTGGEMLYSSSVVSVDHTRGELDLLTRDNFNISRATIVLKDGRVVPATELKSRDAVLVASASPHGAYEKNAMFVQVTSQIDKIFEMIRIGAVESVNPSTMTLANYTQYTHNSLDRVNPNVSGHYKFFTHTKIKDITDPKKIESVSAQNFFHNKYARSENPSTTPGLKYKRYYAFMVANPLDNSIIAMNVRKFGLLELDPIDKRLTKESDIPKTLQKTFKDAVLTRGVVAGQDKTWSRLELTDAHDYTDYTGRWTPTKTNIFIKYSDAIIIKNYKAIDITDIRAGDYVYVMRIKSGALVIFVE